MPPLNLSTLKQHEKIQSDFLVVERTEKTTKDGKPYAILTLGNPTGKIDTAPIWSENLPWADGAVRGQIVQAIGDVALYGPKRQLSLTAPLRLLPNDQYRIEDFIESVGDCTALWDWIDKRRAEMQSRTLRNVVDIFFADDDFRIRFERTPASITRHHSKLGGLLLHVYEVASIARNAARTMRANSDLVLAGALLHDIGKVESYEISPAGLTYTACGLLVGHVVLGVLMLERALHKLGEPVCTPGQLLELQHMILSHHGALQFGSPVEPMTVEAELLHWADETSAKADDMTHAISDDTQFSKGDGMSDRRVWRVGGQGGRSVFRRDHDWD